MKEKKMDWAQVLVIVLPVMLAIIVGIIYNNRRIDDLRSDVNQRFIELRGDIREIRAMLMEFLKKEAGVH
jgi:hypothetical protein